MSSIAVLDQFHYLGIRSHLTLLQTSFQKYFETQTFTDVTLMCEDGGNIQCHKVVLAASSSFFEKHFGSTPPDETSTVLIKDVKFSELMDVLDYIYKGRANINNLEAFSKVAKMLKLKGLCGEESDDRNEFTIPRSKYSKENMPLAVRAVKNGMSVAAAAQSYGVCGRTLYNKLDKTDLKGVGRGGHFYGPMDNTPNSPGENSVCAKKETETEKSVELKPGGEKGSMDAQ